MTDAKKKKKIQMSANNYFSSINWCWKSMFLVSIDKYMDMFVLCFTCFPDILKKVFVVKHFITTDIFCVRNLSEEKVCGL